MRCALARAFDRSSVCVLMGGSSFARKPRQAAAWTGEDDIEVLSPGIASPGWCAPPRRSRRISPITAKDCETKLWTTKGAEETRLSLRGAVRDEAISVLGQRWLRCARHDTLTLCHVLGVLSHSPKPPSIAAVGA